jgi:membrane-bound lytic murein transglycosylase B
MPFHILTAAAAAATLIGSVNVDITVAQVAAVHYGRVLGAAAQCHDIDHDRISSATHQASSIVHARARSNQDLEKARGSFETAAMDGGARVSNGEENCVEAESALKRVEGEFKASK